jgi:hypothetical protein
VDIALFSFVIPRFGDMFNGRMPPIYMPEYTYTAGKIYIHIKNYTAPGCKPFPEGFPIYI